MLYILTVFVESVSNCIFSFLVIAVLVAYLELGLKLGDYKVEV